MTERRRKAARFGERDAVALFSRVFGVRAPGVASVGVGDDAAVLEPVNEKLVWTVDACLEGSHFERTLLSLEDIGYRAFHAAASDLAAMGARPLAALSALELPPGFSRRELGELTRGQALAARECGSAIVGGNVARAGRLGVTTTLLGSARAPLQRKGARPGDELWLIGDVGLAAAGLAVLQAPGRGPHRGAARHCILAWRRPRALIAQGTRLVGRARAAMDVSDGLAGDLLTLARASKVRAVLDLPALLGVLRPELVRLAESTRRSAVDFALYGGEDYAIVATGPAARRPSFARRLGRIESGTGAFLEDERGRRAALRPGFDHLGS